MKGWESQLPADFPIERLARDAVRTGEQRKLRRLQRNQRVLSGLCVVLLVGMVALVAGRDEPGEQLQAGPGPSAPAGGLRVDVVEVTARNGKIAFIRSTGPSDPAPSIYLMNEDGSEQRKIAETTQGGGLAWSPDGTKLTFRDVGGIYMINADGSGEQRVTGVSSHWAGWSPDGRKIVFRDSEAGGIAVANLDGSGRRTLTRDAGASSPTWSPDGRRIAFTKDNDIWVMNADGSNQKKLVELDGFVDSITWSPDGRQIVFRHNSAISAVDVDGGRARALASPGGTGAIDPQGRGASKLATTRGDPATPQWSPDGTKIVYTIYQTGEACSIWVMSADGGVQNPLTDNRTCDRDPAWQPLKP